MNNMSDIAKTSLARRLLVASAVLVSPASATFAAGPYSGPGGAISPPSGTLTLEISVPDHLVIDGLSVMLEEVVHPWAGDLVITLTHLPTNKSMKLADRLGNGDLSDSSDFLGDYSFADVGGNIWSVAAGLPASAAIAPGAYRATGGSSTPVSMAAVFGGIDAHGTWRLKIEDMVIGDDASLGGWTIAFDAPATFMPAAPYTSLADSFIVQGGGEIGVDGYLVEFEGGPPALLGAELDVSFLIAPGPITDSVDGDDGAIDGIGVAGNSAAEFMGVPITIEFDAEILGGLPTRFGVVVTDMLPGSRNVRLDVYGDDGAHVAGWTYTLTGDTSESGSTAEDRLLAVTRSTGIGRVEVTGIDSNIEIDHIQYDVPTPQGSSTAVLGATPYLSTADSGFAIGRPGAEYFLLDFEGGDVSPFGAELALSFVVPPGAVTDSVDADDGIVDGSGLAGTSGAELRGKSIVVEFDEAMLGSLPRDFGLVVTDIAQGPAMVRMRAFDAQGKPSFLRYFTVTGDASNAGTTADDAFLGVSADDALLRVEIVCLSGNMEVDHIQYGTPASPPASPGDLDANGAVDGADLGILLGAWGGRGVGDLNRDGLVDGADLGLLLGEWN